jgi:hypothetical protein
MDVMLKPNKLDSSFKKIEVFFDQSQKKTFSFSKFYELINLNRNDWIVPETKTNRHVIDYLLKREVLFENLIIDENNKPKVIYSWKTQDELTVLSALKKESYFSHFSSMFLNQLTLQIPKTLYLNFEHSPQTKNQILKSNITQKNIDQAFESSQRKSSKYFLFNDKKVIIVNGKYTGKIGVVNRINSNQNFEYTDTARTLIDIAVRPVYSGGVFEVLEAFKIAKGKVNINKIAEYLSQLNFSYPYHQVIGFYLQKAGYSLTEYILFKRDMNFDFYLTYGIRNREYSNDWRIYYPKEF